MSEYVLADVDRAQRERLEAMDRATEDVTRQLMSRYCPQPGMVCADVAAGVGGVARWLCEQVGPTGRVVATDLEVRWLEEIDAPNLEVRRSNILTDSLGEAEFDLIHARALLTHVDPLPALSNMVRALRPGGRLVVGDPDLGTTGMVYPPVEPLERFWSALAHLISAAGGDPYTGRKLPHLLRTSGLVDIEAQSMILLQWTEDVYVTIVKHVAPILVAAGGLSAEDFVAIEALPRGVDSFLYGMGGVLASGRKRQVA
jgi:SAM-dependent methyltransferase